MNDTLQKSIKEIGQQHIVQRYYIATQSQKQQFKQQFDTINNNYPGGIIAYIQKARKLLQISKEGLNPYQGLTPSVPKGVTLDYNSQKDIIHYQSIGEQQIKHVGFVLVAGGLGERLGYNGIKIQIPMDTCTETRFIQYYISYILAIQQKLGQGCKIPLAIMTSEQTHSLTVSLLESQNYYGLDANQVTFIKQINVPALLDNTAKLALQEGKLKFQTRPYGHGNVHSLLHSHKIPQVWKNKYGTKWIVFFQDTNPLFLRSIIATVGVSKQLNLQMNSIGVRFKPGEDMGAITKLTNANGKHLIINVEYNQLNSLLNSMKGKTIDEQGYSLLAGNINVLVMNLDKYNNVLVKTKGNVDQFINPKYTDNTFTSFKSPSRIQCMMQDYPKLLDNCDNVGFTIIDRRFCYTSVKNDIKSAAGKVKIGLSSRSASVCEADVYECNRLLLLKICGAQIAEAQPIEFCSIKSHQFPRIFLSPRFSITLKQMKSKVKKLKISSNSTLIIQSDCILQDVQVDGSLKISNSGNIIIKQTNKKYQKLVPTEGTDPQWLLIRGFKPSL